MRNDKLFAGKLDVAHVVANWDASDNEFSSALVVRTAAKGLDRGLVRWLPPKDGHLVINVDDAWKGGWCAIAK